MEEKMIFIASFLFIASYWSIVAREIAVLCFDQHCALSETWRGNTTKLVLNYYLDNEMNIQKLNFVR